MYLIINLNNLVFIAPRITFVTFIELSYVNEKEFHAILPSTSELKQGILLTKIIARNTIEYK